MNMSDRECLVKGIEEAARAGYRQGWDDGYEAARMTVEQIVKEWRKDPVGLDLKSALDALDMSKEKAREMLGRDKFDVVFAPLAEPGQKWFG